MQTQLQGAPPLDGDGRRHAAVLGAEGGGRRVSWARLGRTLRRRVGRG